MKLKSILLCSLLALFSGCTTNEEEPKAFHFGPGPNGEVKNGEPQAYRDVASPKLEEGESVADSK